MTISRQLRWKRERVKRGQCSICGKSRGRNGTAVFCLDCLIRRRRIKKEWYEKRRAEADQAGTKQETVSPSVADTAPKS